MVTLTLRNVGQQAFWTSKTIGFAHMAGAFDLEAVDETGVKLRDQFAVPDGPVGHESFDAEQVVRWIMQEKLIFIPGNFLGFEQSLQSGGFQMARPGRYTFKAVYFDLDLETLGFQPKVVRQVKKQLPLPLWSGRIESSPVTITVVP